MKKKKKKAGGGVGQAGLSVITLSQRTLSGFGSRLQSVQQC